MAGGFRPFSSLSTADFNSKVRTFYVASGHASLLAVGDLVVETGTAANNPEGYSEVDAVTAGGLILGAIVSIDPNFSNLSQAGLPASTAGYVKVLTDPYALYYAEVAAGGIVATDVGLNADVTATAATATGGVANSNMVITSSFGSGSAGVRIVSLVDGAVGASATVVCRINESSITSTTGV